MKAKSNFRPKSFAVVGAGPVGCIVAAFLAKGGYDVTLCDVFPELLKPALNPGIIIEGAENLQQTVTRTCTSIDDLADMAPDVIILTVKANALPLISSAIEGFYKEGMYVISWQNGIDTEAVIAQTLGKKTSYEGCGKLWMRACKTRACTDAVSSSPALSPGACSRISPRSCRNCRNTHKMRAIDQSYGHDYLHGMAKGDFKLLYESGLCGDRTDHGPGNGRPHRVPDRGCPGQGMRQGGKGQ